ncbi:LAMI_0E02058g1_1 [Lachancea mirantina]|uniref:LAMI_0E02058g1_1 n=1 Tax=Lachancea mirantina TaxID=1230905 RepID=A0A1G4JIY2_9SACH|nr:LAMI_0E02058g1_1 [Lachancea mirantina]
MSSSSRGQLITCFIGSNIVALGAGTPYLYSYYAPQLLEKCKLPISKSSTLSFALTIGSAAMGFLAGMVIDQKSPEFSCGIGALCTFLGYATLKFCYTNEIASIILLSTAVILIGFGSVSGFYGSVKCCTTNFPHHRGTAGAFPVSLYALAGLIYSSTCAWLFQDRIDEVFTFLMCVCSSMILIGCFTLKILVKFPEVKRRNSSVLQFEQRDQPEVQLSQSQPIAIRQSPRLSRNSMGSHNDYRSLEGQSMQRKESTDSRSSLASLFQKSESYIWARELPGSLSFWGWGKTRAPRGSVSHIGSSRRDSESAHHPRADDGPHFNENYRVEGRDSFMKMRPVELNSAETPDFVAPQPIDVDQLATWKDSHLYQTITQLKFIALYLTLAILQGIGQTYIFSVGFVVDTLAHSYPEAKFNNEKVQSLQVSLISVMSFGGRLLAGPISDLLVKKLGAQRGWCILFAGGLMFLACRQIVSDPGKPTILLNSRYSSVVDNVSLSSVLFGFGFGITFGTFPAIVADQFGTKGFSTVWGLFTTGGMISVKIFTAIFARDLVANTGPDEKVCSSGPICYASTFHLLSRIALVAAMLISSIMAVSFWKNLKRRQTQRHRVDFEIDSS